MSDGTPSTSINGDPVTTPFTIVPAPLIFMLDDLPMFPELNDILSQNHNNEVRSDDVFRLAIPVKFSDRGHHLLGWVQVRQPQKSPKNQRKAASLKQTFGRSENTGRHAQTLANRTQRSGNKKRSDKASFLFIVIRPEAFMVSL